MKQLARIGDSVLLSGGGERDGGGGGACWRRRRGRGEAGGEGGEALALLVLLVGGALDEDDAPALDHLAEAAQPLHRRADLHLLLPPLVVSSGSGASDPVYPFDATYRVWGVVLGFRF